MGLETKKREDQLERFWETLSECVSGFEQGVRMMMFGDVNASVGNMAMEGMIEKFGLSGVNWAGERMVEFCAEAESVVGNTWVKK
jgi:hypothetical protein